MIHVDVMDGHFVPPITIGSLIVSALGEQVHDAGGMLDVHLMIDRPERHVEEFARAGADQITVHFEATPHVHYAVKTVREAGCLAGVAITPSTPADSLAAIAADIDTALCMTVNPGWGGQRFIPETLPRSSVCTSWFPSGSRSRSTEGSTWTRLPSAPEPGPGCSWRGPP